MSLSYRPQGGNVHLHDLILEEWIQISNMLKPWLKLPPSSFQEKMMSFEFAAFLDAFLTTNHHDACTRYCNATNTSLLDLYDTFLYHLVWKVLYRWYSMKETFTFSAIQWIDIVALYGRQYSKQLDEMMQWSFRNGKDLKTSCHDLQIILSTVLEESYTRVTRMKSREYETVVKYVADMLSSLDRISQISLEFWGRVMPDLGFTPGSLGQILVLLYEGGLSKLSERSHVVGDMRLCILNLMHRWMTWSLLHLPGSDEDQCDVIFTWLNELAYVTHMEENIPALQQGSLLSDFHRVFDLKVVLRKGFTDIDSTRLEYLDLLLSQLPQRVGPDMTDSEKVPHHTNERAVKLPEATILAVKRAEKVVQIRQLFDDLGEGFVQRCLEVYHENAEQVINAILENSLPEELQELDRQLPAPAVFESKPAAKEVSPEEKTSAAAPEKKKSSTKMDSSQIWIGKKKGGEAYDPTTIRQDAAFHQIQRQLLENIDDEPELGDMYDDEYDDEFDEYTPVPTREARVPDMDAILAENKAVRAKEAEGEFWDSMRNKNYPKKVATPDDEGGDGNSVSPLVPAVVQMAAAGVSATKGPATKEDPKKEAGKRRNKSQNKAKIGNHNRKNQALKKRG